MIKLPNYKIVFGSYPELSLRLDYMIDDYYELIQEHKEAQAILAVEY